MLVQLDREAEEDEAELLAVLNPTERSTLIPLLRCLAESQSLTAGVHPELGAGRVQDHGDRH